MQPTTSLRALGAGVAIFGIVLAGCGGSGGGSAAAKVASLNGSGGTTTTAKPASAADFRTAALAYAKCMRAKGINFPDPVFDANGRPQFGFRDNDQAPNGANRDNPKFQAARQACAPILEKARASFQPTPQQLAQMRKNLLAYAKCMRAQGVNFPDPTFDANGRPQFGQHSASGETRDVPEDPKTQKASQTCRQQVGGGQGPGGFFGGGHGGGGGGGGDRAPGA